jgi:preprotein translocase subunit SecD
VATTNVPRPGRVLAVFLVAIVAAYAAMYLMDATSPRLGLDLQGGTSVILQPRVIEGGGDISPDQLQEAVNIIRQRVNSFGVAEAEVQTQSSNIVVSVPGATDRQAINQIGQTAQLRFRPVLVADVVQTPPTQPTPTPTPTGSAPATPAPTGKASATPTPRAGATNGRAVPPAFAPAAQQPPAPVQQPPAPVQQPPAPVQQPPAPAQQPPAQTPPVVPPATGQAEITPELQEQFAKLDCSKPENRRGGGRDVPNEPTVACDRDGGLKYILAPTAVEGTRVENAAAEIPQGTSQFVVTLDFDGEGTRQFGQVTTELVAKTPPQNQFAIVLDGVVVSAPRVNEAITGAQGAEISGDFTQKEAQNLANVLRFGALPVAFDPGEVSTISPTLGSDQLDAGLLAGAIGLALVVVYSVLYYRGLAIVSVLSLAVAAMLTFAAVCLLSKAIGFTLTLAGVAGLIVAIGITADSFVVYFERLRDEVREGKSIRLAAEHGWARARRTILAADFVSFLAAVVLYFLSVGGVRGFAFTLGLTTLIDVVVVFLFTKPLVTLLVRTKFFGGGHRWSGLDPAHLGTTKSSLVSPRKRVGTAVKEA